ncbi:hypothetical protein D1159_11620 [Pseudoflavonifractor sp. 524-17]|uniref:class I SAM-dependent methyltransferase n=1 Tax=Pseudoflavonifractor sp. 524-17 TaxID=2304577 RepID=UPI00137ACDC6|nr:SAM-dependent methyltransferase [Pseudoflavonifractor sp. 524-17]NCE65206.1 hypothetical protein [Pseudoflavonifractor sp. 524-17]
MDTIQCFSGLAQIYAQARPGCPDHLMDWLFAPGRLAAGQRVADIGAGTGLFSQALLERGAQVWAVEPNGDMAQEAR